MRLLIICVSIIALTISVHAQEGYEHFSVAAHGAGQTYVVTSRGLDAVGLNPALLSLPAGKRFELRVFPVTSFGIDAGESFRDATVLADIFSQGYDSITLERRQEIIDIIRDEKLSGRGDIGVIAIAYDAGDLGAFALTWTSHAAVRTDLPQDFLDFFYLAESRLLTQPGSTRDLDLQAMWHNEFAATYAHTLYQSSDTAAFLQQLRAGVSLKYASGIGVLKLEDGNYFIWTQRQGGGASIVNVNYRVHSSHINDFDPKNAPNRFSFDFLTAAEAGSGLGADLGVSLGLFGVADGRSALRIGTSVCGIGAITWRSNALERLADNVKDTFETAGSFTDLTDSLRAFEGIKTRLPEFSQSLPTMFRFGAQLDLDALGTEILGFAPQLAFEVAQGLTDVVGSLAKPRFGIGISLERVGGTADYRLCGGFAVDHRAADITLGGGLTLFDHVAFDIATAHLLEVFSSKPRIDVAASLKVLF